MGDEMMNFKKICLCLVSAIFICGKALAIETGEKAPDFSGISYLGKKVSLSDYVGKTVVLEWFNRGCPFVQKHYQNGDMQKLQVEYSEKNVVWLTINSTNTGHTDYLDSEKSKAVIEEWKIKSNEYLIDADGKIGKLYGAKTTPHMYIINERGIYQGAIDDNPDTYADPKTAVNYVKQGLEEHLSTKPVSVSETKSYGCSVKY
jgi:peroxiredoxin